MKHRNGIMEKIYNFHVLHFCKKNVALLLLVCISLLFLFPLTKGNYISHDGQAHIARFAAMYQAFIDGQIPPRWAAGLNFGYGSPVFIFFYPLPDYLASLLHFFKFHFEQSFLILVGLCFIAAPVTFYFWLRTILSDMQAGLVALLYG